MPAIFGLARILTCLPTMVQYVMPLQARPHLIICSSPAALLLLLFHPQFSSTALHQFSSNYSYPFTQLNPFSNSKMTGGKSGGKASATKASAQS
jgi:hypothetical protein